MTLRLNFCIFEMLSPKEKMRLFSNTTLENQVCRPKSGINLYPFGQEMPGRTWKASDYRYSAQGKEKDSEIFEGAQDFGLREYDNRLCRFFNKDPFARYFPNKSPYVFAGNSPIAFIDENGGFQVVPGVSGVSGKRLKALQKIAKAVSTLANESGGNNDFVDAFMASSGIADRAKALEILSYGSGPIVVVSNDPGIMGNARGDLSAGKYYGGQADPAKEFVFINDKIISGAAGENIILDYDQTELSSKIIGIATLWHEGIHYADNLDCKDQTQNGGEPGNQAEINLFGFQPGYRNLRAHRKGNVIDSQGNEVSGAPPTGLPGYFLGQTSTQFDFWRRANADRGLNSNKGYAGDLRQIGQLLKSAINGIRSVNRSESSGGKSEGTYSGNDRFLD